MAVNIPGVISMVFFYLVILGVGIWASFKSKRKESKSAADKVDMALLGNRSINKVVGIFTMTGPVLHYWCLKLNKIVVCYIKPGVSGSITLV